MATKLSRRSFLGGAAAIGAGSALLRASPTSAQTGVAAAANGTVVVVNLVGGVDGLSVAVPYESDDYHRLRPTVAVGRPDRAGGAIPFAPRWGVHPAFAPLLNTTAGSAFATIVGVGSADELRSRGHGAATRRLYRTGRSRPGLAAPLLAANGLTAAECWWFGSDRHPLFHRVSGATGGRRPSAPVIGFSDGAGAHEALRLAFADDARLGSAALTALDGRWATVQWDATGMPADRGYADAPIGDRLAAVADMIRSDDPLRLVVVDQGGYDTHRAQGDGAGGVLASRLDELVRSLAAFWSDLGSLTDEVTVVVLSEFGRTVHENRRGGTNHGRGGIALLLDRGVRAGLHGDVDIDFERGVLPATTDVHAVIGEVFAHRGWRVPDGWSGDDDDRDDGDDDDDDDQSDDGRDDTDEDEGGQGSRGLALFSSATGVEPDA